MIPFWKFSSALLRELFNLRLLSLSLSVLFALFFEFDPVLLNQFGDLGKLPLCAGSSSEVRV
jgi:hypothetical protein